MPSEVRNSSLRSRIKVHHGLTGKSFEIRHYSYNLSLPPLTKLFSNVTVFISFFKKLDK